MSTGLLRSVDMLHRIAPFHPAVQPHEAPHFFPAAAASDMKTLLKHPNHLFIELGAQHDLEASIAKLQKIRPDLAISFTTRTAHHAPIAHELANCLAERFVLSESVRQDIETCLHEAITNAVIHGNLDLGGKLFTNGHIDARHSAIQSRLTQAEYTARRVTIITCHDDDGLTLSIGDEGSGIGILPPASAPPPDATALSGRGFFLMRALAHHVWIEDDRRQTIAMRFLTGGKA